MARIGARLALALLFACGAVNDAGDVAQTGWDALEGVWGGAGRRLTVRGNDAVLEWPCGHARFASITWLDRSRFNAEGELVSRSGTPMRSDEGAELPPLRRLVAARGEIAGSELMLELRPQDGESSVARLMRDVETEVAECG